MLNIKKINLILIGCLLGSIANAEDDPLKAALLDYYMSLANPTPSAILQNYNRDYLGNLKTEDELKIKVKYVKEAQKLAKSDKKTVDLSIKNVKKYHGDTVAQVTYTQIYDDNSYGEQKSVQLQTDKEGKWKLALQPKNIPASKDDCVFVAEDLEKTDLEVKIPGVKVRSGNNDYRFVLAYPSDDKRIPPPNDDSWNHVFTSQYRYMAPEYKQTFKNSYAIIKTLKDAGFVNMKEGHLHVSYANYQDKMVTQKVSGVIFSFTKKGEDTLLKTQSPSEYYDKMFIGRIGVKTVGDTVEPKNGGQKYQCTLYYGLLDTPLTFSKEILDYFKSQQNIFAPRFDKVENIYIKFNDGKWEKTF